MEASEGAEEMPIASRGAVLIKDPKKRRKCPICSQNLFLYYVDFDKMFLMCENSLCDFPFGFEPLQVVYDESQLVDNPPKATEDFFEYPVGGIDGTPPTPLGTIDTVTTTTFSAVSSSLISDHHDYDQLSLTGDSDSFSISKDDILSVRLSKQGRKRKVKKSIDKVLQNNLNSIKKLNQEMLGLADESSQLIQNKKWLNNLKTWESQSGKLLLKDDEKVLLNKTEPEFDVGELKISVNPQARIPCVNIEILKPKKEEKTELG